MSARELLGGLVQELPALEPVQPLVFLEDARLPQTIALVEPAAFALACVQALWGPRGLSN
jgi:hypothetical protein